MPRERQLTSESPSILLEGAWPPPGLSVTTRIKMQRLARNIIRLELSYSFQMGTQLPAKIEVSEITIGPNGLMSGRLPMTGELEILKGTMDFIQTLLSLGGDGE